MRNFSLRIQEARCAHPSVPPEPLRRPASPRAQASERGAPRSRSSRAQVRTAAKAFEEELRAIRAERRRVLALGRAAGDKQAELEESRGALEHVTEADQRTLTRARPRAVRRDQPPVNTAVVNLDTVGNLRGRPLSVATFASADAAADRGEEDEVAALFDAVAQMTGETDLGMLAKHLIFASKAQQLAGFSLAEVEQRRAALHEELGRLDEELEGYILAGAANTTKRAHIDEIERRLKRARGRLAARADDVSRLARTLAPVAMGMEVVARKLAGLHLPPTSAHSLRLRIAKSLAEFSKISAGVGAAADASAAAQAAAQAEAEAAALSVAADAASFSAADNTAAAAGEGGGDAAAHRATAASRPGTSGSGAAGGAGGEGTAMPSPWDQLRAEASTTSVSALPARPKLTQEADQLARARERGPRTLPLLFSDFPLSSVFVSMIHRLASSPRWAPS